MKQWLYKKWESKGLINKCICLGDFNVDMESHPERVQIFNEMQKKSQPLIDENNINPNLEIVNVNEDQKEEEKHPQDKNDYVLTVDNQTKSSSKDNEMAEDLVSSNEMEVSSLYLRSTDK